MRVSSTIDDPIFLARLISRLLRDLRNGPLWSLAEPEIVRIEEQTTPMDRAPASDIPEVEELRYASDKLLDALGPCHASVRKYRRRGIVRCGVDVPDDMGYPFIRPFTSGNAQVFKLIDEREWYVVRVKSRRVRVDLGHGTREYEYVDLNAPEPEIFTRDTFRAFYHLSLSALYKMCLAPGFPGLRKDDSGGIRVSSSLWLPHYYLEHGGDTLDREDDAA